MNVPKFTLGASLFCLSFFSAGIAHSQECVNFPKISSMPNVSPVPTDNGKLYVIYQTNSPLHRGSMRLSNGRVFKGAKPNLVPTSFFYVDNTDTVHEIKRVEFDFASSKNTPKYVEYSNRSGNVFDKDDLRGAPLKQVRKFIYRANSQNHLIKFEIGFPDALIGKLCVYPGVSLKMSKSAFRRLLKW